jgi:DnaK suppressor protein
MLNRSERDHIRGLLIRERAQALRALERLEERTEDLRQRVGDLNPCCDLRNVGTEVREGEKELLLASNEGRRLYEIEEILRELDERPDEFGLCKRCRGPISIERLEIIPHTRYCRHCQTDAER